MYRKTKNSLFVLMLAAAVLLLLACSDRTSTSNALAQDGAAQNVKPKSLDAKELAKLRWIEGTWRGTGDVDKPFYERYYFENDSTLVVESYTDETLSKVSDVTKFEVKDGQFGNGGDGARWAATGLDDQSVTFSPIARARNTFRWQRESKDLWKAVLDWPAADGKPARQRVYSMERYSYKTP